MKFHPLLAKGICMQAADFLRDTITIMEVTDSLASAVAGGGMLDPMSPPSELHRARALKVCPGAFSMRCTHASCVILWVEHSVSNA